MNTTVTIVSSFWIFVIGLAFSGPMASEATQISPLHRIELKASEESSDSMVVRGKITKIEGNVIILKIELDERKKVKVSDKTQYTLDGRRVTLADLRFGHAVRVRGTPSNDQIAAEKIDATTVK